MVDTTGSRRWLAVGALALSCLAIGIDGTVLSLALPTLSVDLHASTSQLQWFVDAYLLVLGAMMIPAGLLGDRIGRKRVLVFALALFAIGSLACAYSTTSGQLIMARAVLGLAAAFILPLALGVLPVIFAEHERQRAIAIVASSAIVAYPLGPILGGWLLTHYWWGSVFLINVPVIALAILAVAFLLPESRSAQRPGLDPIGIVLSIAGLSTLTYGVIEAGQHGWGDHRAISGMVAGAIVLVGFVLWESAAARRGSQPLVDLKLFATAGFSWGTILATLVSFAMMGVLFSVPQYLRAALGFNAMGAGVRLLPMIGGMFVGLGIGDRMSRWVGSKHTSALGFAITAGGFGVAAFTTVHNGTGYIALWIAVVGFGVGFALPSTMNAAMAQLSKERAGVGSALLTAVRQVGGTFGVAILGSALNSGYHSRLDLAGLPPKAVATIKDNVASGIAVADKLGSPGLRSSIIAAFVHGSDVMAVVSGGVAVAGFVIALLFLPRRVASADGVEEVPRGTTPPTPPTEPRSVAAPKHVARPRA